MRVLEIVAPARVGGLERVVRMLAEGLSDRGHVVEVLAVLTRAGSHPFVESLREARLPTRPVLVSPRGYLTEWRAVRAACREFAPDVVHTHGYRSDVLDAAAARSLGIPIVTTLHGFTGGDSKNRLYEWLQLRAVRRADAAVAVSGPLADGLKRAGVAPSVIHVIRNAWNADHRLLDRAQARRVLRVPQDSFVAGWVGRLSAEKGPDVFVDALALTADTGITGCIIGEGPERAALDAQAKRLGVDRSICWCGTVPDAAALYSAFDCFVLSSRTEGTPIVLFEAMAAQVPIVATAVGGVPDVVGGDEAPVVRPGGTAELAAAIRWVHDHAEEARHAAGAALRRLARDFAVGPWLAQYEGVFREVCERSGRGPEPQRT